MNAVVALLGGVRATVFAGLALALLIAAGVQTWRLDRVQKDRDHWVAASAAAVEANKATMQTIADLRTRNEEWARMATESAKKAAAAADTLARERAERAKALEQFRRDRRNIYENDPEAAAWGRTRVPDAIADRLRY